MDKAKIEKINPRVAQSTSVAPHSIIALNPPFLFSWFPLKHFQVFADKFRMKKEIPQLKQSIGWSRKKPVTASDCSYPATQWLNLSTSAPSPLIAPNPRSPAPSKAPELLGATQATTGGFGPHRYPCGAGCTFYAGEKQGGSFEMTSFTNVVEAARIGLVVSARWRDVPETHPWTGLGSESPLFFFSPPPRVRRDLTPIFSFLHPLFGPVGSQSLPEVLYSCLSVTLDLPCVDPAGSGENVEIDHESINLYKSILIDGAN
ncbi:hypothetical protein U1Q18_018155 [Sarracenia purpurea var. burkii]